MDGKPSVLEGNDALRQTPASSIHSVELITNPSAKYEPDGSAGIINIITKKNRQQGINGIANASLFSSGEYSADVMLSRRMEKLNIYGGLNLSDRPTPNEFHRERLTYSGDTVRSVIADGEWIWGRAGRNLRLGGDYYFNDRNTLSFAGRLGQFNFRYDNPANFHDFTTPASEESYYSQQNEFFVKRKFYSTNLNYEHKFDDKGHKITANIVIAYAWRQK